MIHWYVLIEIFLAYTVHMMFLFSFCFLSLFYLMFFGDDDYLWDLCFCSLLCPAVCLWLYVYFDLIVFVSVFCKYYKMPQQYGDGPVSQLHTDYTNFFQQWISPIRHILCAISLFHFRPIKSCVIIERILFGFCCGCCTLLFNRCGFNNLPTNLNAIAVSRMK